MRIVIVVGFLFGFISVAQAQPVPGNAPGSSTLTPSYTKPAQYTNQSGDQINISVTTATALSCPTGSLYATVAIIGGAVEYRTDGTAPTATVGIPAGVTTSGTPDFFSVSPLSNVSFIAQSGTGTTISYECFK